MLSLRMATTGLLSFNIWLNYISLKTHHKQLWNHSKTLEGGTRWDLVPHISHLFHQWRWKMAERRCYDGALSQRSQSIKGKTKALHTQETRKSGRDDQVVVYKVVVVLISSLRFSVHVVEHVIQPLIYTEILQEQADNDVNHMPWFPYTKLNTSYKDKDFSVSLSTCLFQTLLVVFWSKTTLRVKLADERSGRLAAKDPNIFISGVGGDQKQS